jgi:hypothetical protein
MPTLLEQEKKTKHTTVETNKNNFFILLIFGLINELKRGGQFKGKEGVGIVKL